MMQEEEEKIIPRYPWDQIPYFIQDWRKFSWSVQERLIDDHAYRGEEIILVGLEKRDERLLKMMEKIRGDPEKRKQRKEKMKQIGGAIWKKLKEDRAQNRRAGSSKENWADKILKSLNSPKHDRPIITKKSKIGMSKKRDTSILTAKRSTSKRTTSSLTGKRATPKKRTTPKLTAKRSRKKSASKKKPTSRDKFLSAFLNIEPQTKRKRRKRSTSRSRRGSGVLSSKRDYSVLTSRSSRGSGVLNSNRDYSVLSL